MTAEEGMSKWIVMMIVVIIVVAIMLLFGQQMVKFVIDHVGWKATIRCDPAIANC